MEDFNEEDLVNYRFIPTGDIISGETTEDVLVACIAVLAEQHLTSFYKQMLKDYDGTVLCEDVTPDGILFVMRTKGLLIKCDTDGEETTDG